MYRYFFKRLVDLAIAVTAFLILLPVFIMLFLFLSVYYRGNPFFLQKRPGYRGRVFSVIKFKSMLDIYDAAGNPLPDMDRITKVGVFLRKSSLDELPQLINVIKGDMSFIGPRPLLVRYLPYYTEREYSRHNVRPGITGLAQVSGRNFLPWKDRLELDAQYVEKLSFSLDLKIFLTTVVKVIKRSDVRILANGVPFDVYRRNEELSVNKSS
jgi:lipopolysaccharide/colanic/teichoic acid biosynthesis glycosyltransferase